MESEAFVEIAEILGLDGDRAATSANILYKICEVLSELTGTDKEARIRFYNEPREGWGGLTRISYEVSDRVREVDTSVSYSESKKEAESPKPSPSTFKETPLTSDQPIKDLSLTNREPDVKSVPATVTFDYPERVNPALYRVVSKVNVRDFPSMQGKVIGTLRPNDTVVGNEIEGSWVRIYANSYTSLNFLKKIN